MVDVDGVFYSARLGVMKPDPAFFAKVEAALGLHGEELLLIDDRRENTEAALKAGWQTLDWTKDSSPGILRTLWR
jgi:HAD superfamily hydrolase (TIGR01509 family)